MEGLTFSYRDGEDPQYPSVIQTIKLNGSPVGYVEAFVANKYFQVGNSMITDPRLRGKGIGALAYVDLWRYVKSKYGFGLSSDVDGARSEQAEMLWKKLHASGKARKIRIAGAPAYMMEGPFEDHGLTFSVRSQGPRVALIQVGELRDASGKVVGSIRVTENDSIPGAWQISHSSLDRSLRGKGVGGAMYRAMQRHLRGQGQHLASDVQRSDSAEQLWRGFVQKGEARLVPQDDGSAIYVMRN